MKEEDTRTPTEEQMRHIDEGVPLFFVHAPASNLEVNRKSGKCERPPIMLSKRNANGTVDSLANCWGVEIRDKDGTVIGRMVYDRAGKSKRGRQLWLEIYEPASVVATDNFYPDTPR